MYSSEFTERFWRQVVKGEACWLWSGNKDACGYGVIKYHQKALKAHRVAYELTTGQHPGKLCVLHSCDNPGCVNPKHLTLGTPGDNARDRSRKGRSGNIRGEKNGRAKLTAVQVQEIRRLYRETHVSKVQLGKQFGVSDVQIGFILRNEEWREQL